MPGVHLQGNVLASLLNETSFAFHKRPQHDVVFLTVETNSEVVAAWFEIEENARALIELTSDEFEAH